MNHCTIKKIDNIEKIKQIICKYDRIFVPSISSIVDIDEYIEKIFNYGITIIMSNESDDIGFCSFYCNDYKNKIAYISLIAIKPLYEGCGYSNFLMKYVENYCTENGMTKIKLEVYNHNQKAIKFYQKNGFTFCNENSNDNTKYMEKIKR